MLTGILFFSLLILWGALVFNGKAFMNPKRRRYLGILVPQAYLDHPQVTSLVKAYQKRNKQWFYLSGLATFMIFLFKNSFSLMYTYFTLYFFAVFIAQFLLMYQYQESMKKLKYKLNWQEEKSHKVYVNTELSQYFSQERKPIFIWLLMPLLFSFYPFIFEKTGVESLQWIFTLMSLVILLIGFFIINRINNTHKVYSHDAEINQQLNRVIKNRWVYGIVVMVIYQVVVNNYLYHLMMHKSSSLKITIILSLLSLIIIIVLVYIHKINEALIDKSGDKSMIEVLEEEDYWYGGMFYSNPSNSKLFVSDKTGINITLNLGKKSGKILMFGILILTSIVMIGSCGLIVLEEQLQPTINFSETAIKFSAILYNDEINYDDVVSIFLVDSLKEGMKTNGSATDKYARGSFNIPSYGSVRLYIFKDSKPYLAIQTKNRYYFYSSKETEETYRVYRTLEDKINH